MGKPDWWFRMDAGFLRNPKIVEAGFHGWTTFLAILVVHADVRIDGKHLDGELPAAFASRGFLARQADTTTEHIEKGIQRCVEVGLIELTEHGGIRICGWDDTWRPPARTGAERQAKYRNGKRADSGDENASRERHCDVTRDARVTPSDEKPSHRDGRDVEERREKKEERDLDRQTPENQVAAAEPPRGVSGTLGSCCKDGEHRALAAEHRFCGHHRKRYGVPYTHEQGRDRKALGKLPDAYDRAMLLGLVDQFWLEAEADEFTFRKRGVSIPAFVGRVPALLESRRQPARASPALNERRGGLSSDDLLAAARRARELEGGSR